MDGTRLPAGDGGRWGACGQEVVQPSPRAQTLPQFPRSPGTEADGLSYFLPFSFSPAPHTPPSMGLCFVFIRKTSHAHIEKNVCYLPERAGGHTAPGPQQGVHVGSGSSSSRVRPQLGPALHFWGPQSGLHPETGTWRPPVLAQCAGRKELPPPEGEAEA